MMKINTDLLFLFAAIIIAFLLMYLGYLGIFNPMKIINYYSKDDTPFIQRVKAEGLTKRDIITYKFAGAISFLLGSLIFLLNLKNLWYNI